MGKLTADFLLERLAENGVRRIYGYPGDGINAIVGALARATDKLEFVQVRHEEQAALMACAHAKWTGEVGVCLATSGPGAIHLLNGLYDATLDHKPVVALVGRESRMAPGARTRRAAGGHGHRGEARRRPGEGAPRAHGDRRHPRVLHRLDRPPRDEAVVDADERVRHAPDGRLVVPLLGVPPRAWESARAAD